MNRKPILSSNTLRMASLDGLLVFLCVCGGCLLFHFIVAQGDAAFLDFRQMETWSPQTNGSTCYPSYLLGLTEKVRVH